MIPDPIERLEAMQEKVMHAHAYDADSDTMQCADCGQRLSIMELSPISNHPASAFVCDECLRKRSTEYQLRKLRSIAVKLAAFCARLSGTDDVPPEVAKEGMRLAHEFKKGEGE